MPNRYRVGVLCVGLERGRPYGFFYLVTAKLAFGSTPLDFMVLLGPVLPICTRMQETSTDARAGQLRSSLELLAHTIADVRDVPAKSSLGS